MQSDIEKTILDMGQKARKAALSLLTIKTEQKNEALLYAAECLRKNVTKIIDANKQDLDNAQKKGLSGAMIDRLMLDEKRIQSIAKSLEEIAALPDPVGRVLAEIDRPNGLKIKRISVPIGVIAIIYESRPNVTADAGALAMKAGNAVILRGGSESIHSSTAIFECLQEGLKKADIVQDAIQMVTTTDRDAVGSLLTLTHYIDLVIPRGGKSLVKRIQDEARVPVLAHLEGLCHTYIDASADLKQAINIMMNAKMRRTGVCGATETLLIDTKIADKTPQILQPLLDADCEIRGCEKTKKYVPQIKIATEEDFKTEYLDAILSVKIIDGIDGAIKHIQTYGSNHTDAVLAKDETVIEKFCLNIDSANIMVNTSTQFADGGEFGMGAEIGIATGKMHARGPVGLEQLNSFKYIVFGNGQIRPV
jgi:glutamate-5-semialdehyde dehydrogenase